VERAGHLDPAAASPSHPACANAERAAKAIQLFFPDGIAFDGNRFVGTRVTAPAFSYLRPIEAGNEGLVAQNSASWNRAAQWLRLIAGLTTAA
jgi:hypothetical protein